MTALVVLCSVVSIALFWTALAGIAVLALKRPRPQAYCVKERVTREINGAHTVVFRNGRTALQGRCSSCGTTLFRMK